MDEQQQPAPRVRTRRAERLADLIRQELAVMLAGTDYSSTVRKNALELLHKAESWKKTAQSPSPERQLPGF